MSVVLAIMAFILILVGVAVQVGHFTSETKFAVSWTTALAALCLILFAAKVYFS
jgi:hypothetical protein